MVLESPYRGLMAPVFTPFDSKGQLNLDEITNYGKYLAKTNVKSILINGGCGEGAQMSVDERKAVLERWIDVAKHQDLFIMVHVGAANLKSVIEMAQHAESLHVGAILCMPDPFYKPKTVADLVGYLKIVGAAAPKTPLFYYNFPNFTGVNLDMVALLKTGAEQIPTLSGMKHTHTDLDEGIRCANLQNGKFTIFLGNDELTSAALFIGYESILVGALNFASKEISEIRDKIKTGDNEGAQRIQRRINNLTNVIYEIGVPYGGVFKEILSKISGLKLGKTRPPMKQLTAANIRLIEEELKRSNWI